MKERQNKNREKDVNFSTSLFVLTLLLVSLQPKSGNVYPTIFPEKKRLDEKYFSKDENLPEKLQKSLDSYILEKFYEGTKNEEKRREKRKRVFGFCFVFLPPFHFLFIFFSFSVIFVFLFFILVFFFLKKCDFLLLISISTSN